MNENKATVDQLITILDAHPKLKHWRLQRENRNGARAGYSVTVWACEKRWTTTSASLIRVLQKAIDEVNAGGKNKNAPKLRLTK